jgi:hypothetical protein
MVLIIFLNSCRNNGSVINSGGGEGKITISDINDREWDITHAVNNYGMIKENFHFGVGFGTIASIDNPKILSKNDFQFPHADSSFAIFGADVDLNKRAYSRTELIKHEILNDTILTRPAQYLAIAHCPLYNLAAVYDRMLNGTLLTFAASGWTYGEVIGSSLFVLVDKESQSVWFPMEKDGKHGLVCIGGTHKDSFLPVVQQLIRSDWIDWIESNPNTKYVTSR